MRSRSTSLRALAALILVLASASGCGDDGAVPEDGRAAMPLRAIARGEESLRGISSAGIAVRTNRYVTVVGARRSTVKIAGPSALLLPDLDGDRQPEVAASLGPELKRRLAVELSTGGRLVVKRAGWDVLDVRGTIGGRWIVVAYGRGGTWLLGYAPLEQRWVWEVPAADEVDDVDVRGERVRVAGYTPPRSRSVVIDLVVRDDDARVTNREERPVNVRTSDARIAPAWQLEEVNTPRYKGDSPHGRVELTRPDGTVQVLSDSNDDLPASALLRVGPDCAVVALFRNTANITVSAVGADGTLRATQVLPRRGLSGVALLGERMLVSRVERDDTTIRPLALDPRIGRCATP
ncbi:MAG TPA: hypothetical protein VNA28_02400 [Solirubrobacteraceae bacterium]|nr:hypothetical protein [Solirubrobacteraceae bacterium]